ncbi:MAG: hypothetical protein EOP00_29645 [Pedobacter sp.]|nr:MAG: hypothetical protein EOP00_29645 [Pedobacter sp.]
MKKINSKNEEFYEKELQYNIKRLIILDGINKLDHSKIYINEEGLYESELIKLKTTYDRLLSLIEIYIPKENEIASVPSIFEQGMNIIRPSFKELFFAIRNQFLFSKYGLVNYLSTRIRHGIFENAIRPTFKKLNLVTDKNFSGKKYLPNDYWLDQLEPNVSKEKLDRISEELSIFSDKVDAFIAQVLAEKLQIKIETQNKDGLFDFIFHESQIDFAKVFNNQRLDFKSFVYNVYKELWVRNESNLKAIRKFIRNEMRAELNSYLDELEDSLQKLYRKDLTAELFVNIAVCRGNLHKELENIADWFVRTDTQMPNSTLSNILDVTSEHLNSVAIVQKLEIENGLEDSTIIHGRYYVALSDLFRLFLSNILKHSRFEGDLIPVNILSAKVGDSLLCISIISPLGNSVDINEIKQNLKLFEEQHNNVERLVGERNSGLIKAINILKSDLHNENNQLRCEVSEERKFFAELTINLKRIKA